MTMTPGPAARAIVLRDDHLLVMKRTKPDDSKYMVTPGGHIELGEAPEETVLREVAEETTLVIANPRLVYIEHPNDTRWGIQYIYLCDYASGEAVLNPDSEEHDEQMLGEVPLNRYGYHSMRFRIKIIHLCPHAWRSKFKKP